LPWPFLTNTLTQLSQSLNIASILEWVCTDFFLCWCWTSCCCKQ